MNPIDLHCDTMSKLAEQGRATLLRKNDLNVDIGKLQAGKAETGPGIRTFFFASVRLNVVFPLTVAG